MTVLVLDIAGASDQAMTIDTAAPDARSMMLASANAIANTIVDTENTLATTAKEWGAHVFTLAFPAGDDKAVPLDTLIGDSKMAAGWATLSLSDGGSKAKGRLEVYFSNARLVAETFEGLSDDDKRDIRAGTSSVHYRAGLIRKAAADAKKAAKKEADRVTAEQAAEQAKRDAADASDEASNPTPEQAAPLSVADILAMLSVAIDAASDDELNAAYADMGDVVAAFDSRINAASDIAASA